MKEQFKKYIEMNVFDKYQLEVIREGIIKGLDVNVYAKEYFDRVQMHEIKEGLENNLDISIYANPKFDYKQMKQIRLGLEENLDINLYAKPEFDNTKMHCIVESLLKKLNVKDLIGKVEFELLPLFADLNNLGLDISKYFDKDEKFLKSLKSRTLSKKTKEMLSSKGFDSKDFNTSYIDLVKKSILYGLDISPYISKDFDCMQLECIYKGLLKDLDVSWYAKPEFDWQQMNEIKEGLLDNLDVSIYAKPGIDAGKMRVIKYCLKSDIDFDYNLFFKQGFDYLQISEIIAGFKNNLNTSLYSNTKLKYNTMRIIRLALEKGKFKRKDFFDIKIINGKIKYIPKKHNFSPSQLYCIGTGLEQGLDVSIYAKEEFSSEQMNQIKQGLLYSLNASIYAYPEFTAYQMQVIREALLEGTFKRSDYFNTEIVNEELIYIPKDFKQKRKSRK